MPRLRDIANPTHKAGGWFLPHLLTILIVAGVAILAFGLGFWSGRQTYDASYFRQHYDAPLPVITETIQRPKVTAPATLPLKGSINTAYYPGVGNQGSLGSCAAWATAWAITFEYRVQHPGKWPKFSPRCMYDHFSLTYSGGQDAGSWPPLDAELIPTDGIATFKAEPYPPHQIDATYPTVCRNTTYQMPVRFLTLGSGEQMGQGAVDAVKAQLAANHPVLLAIPVYPQFDNAATQPLIVSPQTGQQSRGGHEIVARKWDDTLEFPDGTVGGVEIQNQWSKWWGAYNNRGRAWLSYDFIRHYVFSVQVALIGKDAAPPQAGQPLPPASQTPPVPAPTLPPTATKGKGRWYVHNVVTKDTHKDISRLINRSGDKYGVWPLALAALIGNESGVHQYADREAGGCDYSYGLTQINVCTAVEYGLGDGTTSRANLDRVRAAENHPAVAIDLAARYMQGALRYRGYQIHWPTAYGLFNCGWAVQYSLLVTPGNQCYQNLAVYRQWFAYANQAWAGA